MEATAANQTRNRRYFQGVGRRKNAVARVRLYPGTGNIEVNSKAARDYFGGREMYQIMLREPLRLVNMLDRFNVRVNVTGGGLTGQAGAVRHAVARALVTFEPELRPVLRRAGFLTRDARVKERKKVGLKRARKAPQYTKR